MSKFVGRQITRIEFIYPFLSMAMNLSNMLSLLILALQLPTYFFLILIPSGVGIIFALAYLLDRFDVFTNKHVSHMDINYRKLNTDDVKRQEFEFIKMVALMKAFGSDEQVICFMNAYNTLYDRYKKDWGLDE